MVSKIKTATFNSDLASTSLLFAARTYEQLFNLVYDKGKPVSPRGMRTKELLNTSMLVRNPVDRLVTNPGRHLNVAFAIFEWVAVMAGVDDVAYFKNFVSSYGDYSSDGITLDGAYGRRLNPLPATLEYTDMETGSIVDTRHVGGYSAIQRVIDKLLSDRDTRQAVMAFYDQEDLNGLGGKNTPCTLTMQFLLREDKLHGIVNMRSNDLVRGTCNDVVTFTMILEYVARHIRAELGQMVINAGSLHIYERDFDLVDKMKDQRRWPHTMAEMPILNGDDIALLGDLATTSLNTDGADFFTRTDYVKYWSSTAARNYGNNLANTMRAFYMRDKDKRDALAAYERISDMTLRHLTRPWLAKAGVTSTKFQLGK